MRLVGAPTWCDTDPKVQRRGEGTMGKKTGSSEGQQPGTAEGSANSTVAILNALKARPTIGLLAVGLAVILGGGFTSVKLPGISLESRGSQQLLLLVGGALCLPALIAPAQGAVRRQRVLETPYRLPPEANDVDFLFKIFYNAMPPAFVKRVTNYDDDDSDFDSSDIFFSKAFDHIQKAVTDANRNYKDELAVLAMDYREGDRAVLRDGQSHQLELPPTVGRRRLPILTMKTRFEYKDKYYIAGWYLPVDLGKVPLESEVWLKEVYGQPFLRLLAETSDTSGVQVQVGDALISGRVEPSDDASKAPVTVEVADSDGAPGHR
jgi:hypothetical protein